jgi:hypothetical protein
VTTVRFLSTCLKTLSASLDGGPLATVDGLVAVVGTASGRGHRLVLEKSSRCTGPTSIRNRYTIVRYSDTHKNYIYIKKKLKIK